jgi:hypothetical protein
MQNSLSRIMCMKISSLIVTILIVAGSTSFAWADGTTVATLTGSCTRAMAIKDLTNPSWCSNNVISMEYPNGRVGFKFLVRAKNDLTANFTFLGVATKQIHKDIANLTINTPDDWLGFLNCRLFVQVPKSCQQIQNIAKVIQPIDQVLYEFSGSINNLKAVGTCEFSNPFNNEPSKVSCFSDTSEGTFAGEFISNGAIPNITEIGQ